LLGTGPTTAQFIAMLATLDPTRLAALPGVVGPLIQSTNARTELIDELYSSSAAPLSSLGIGNLLPTDPIATDPSISEQEAASLKKLQGGASIESIIKSIVSSAAYYANAGTNDSADPPDLAWVKQVVSDLLGPSPGNAKYATQVTTYSTALTKAEKTLSQSAARLQVAGTILASADYKHHIVDLVVQNYLNRSATTTDYTAWTGLVGPGAPAAGALTGDEQLLKAVFGRQEYFMLQTDNHGLHTNQSWANSLYTNLQITGFYTSPALATAEAATAAQVLNETQVLAGKTYSGQRKAAAKSLLIGTAYRTQVITNAFLTYTGQPPTSQQLTTWLANFAAGQTQENLFQSLMNTSAFYIFAPHILGVSQVPTPTTFVEAAFTLLFPGFSYTTNNPANPQDISYWTAKMAGGMTQGAVATGLLALPLYLSDPNTGLITRLFKQWIGRSATTTPKTGEIDTWTKNLKAGQHDEDLIAFLLSTPDYFNKSHTFP
jgi:hypothetical protein